MTADDYERFLRSRRVGRLLDSAAAKKDYEVAVARIEELEAEVAEWKAKAVQRAERIVALEAQNEHLEGLLSDLGPAFSRVPREDQ